MMKKILKIFAGILIFVLASVAVLVGVSKRTPARDLPDHLRWEKRFNSVANESDKPIGIRKAPDGNLIVVGESFNGKDFDIFVNKLDGETGELLWASCYAGSGKHIRSNHDQANSFTIDEAGDVYVNGLTCVGYEHGPLPPENSGSDFDALLFKISGTTGETLWEKTYDAGRKHSESGGKIISASSGDHLYLIFHGYDSFPADYRYHVLKIDCESGNEVWWNRETLGWEGRGRPSHLAQDSAGDLIVLGTGTKHGKNPRFFLAKLSAEDGSLVWEYLDPSEGRFNGYPRAMGVGKEDRISVLHSGDEYPEVTCFAGATGRKLWSAGIDSGFEGGDQGAGLIVDQKGDVLVTGRSQDFTFPLTQIQNWTAKLKASDGEELWRTSISIYSRGEKEAPIFSPQIRPSEIHIDSQDRIVICGTSWNGSNLDFYATWLNPFNGNKSHTVIYDGPAGGNDHFSGAVLLPMNKMAFAGTTSNCRPRLKGFKKYWYIIQTGRHWSYYREINSFDDDDPYNYDAIAVKLR